MPRKPTRTRLYVRAGRFYGDFRDYRDVGGGQEALKPAGTNRATDDRAVAEALLTARLGELKRLRRDRAMIGEGTRGATLGEVAREHLILKAQVGKQSDRWIQCAELHLTRACQFFGPNRALTTIGVADLHRWIAALEATKSTKGGTLEPGTIRHHLNALSSVYRRAQSLGYVPVGFNPVASMMPGELPTHARGEADWLEVHEAAWLLEVARTMPRQSNGVLYLYELVATILLTGGRKSEVTGLRVEDLSFNRRTVTFQPHAARPSLKTRRAHRTVPMHPQLAEILGPYVFPPDHPPRGGLLFPSRNRGGEDTPLGDFDKALDALARRAGWKDGQIRAHGLRHTWAAARLQTTDRGAPISLYTVQQEGGWSSDEMLQRIYGHLGTVRHRSEVVEFRAEQHGEAIEKRFGRRSGVVLSGATAEA